MADQKERPSSEAAGALPHIESGTTDEKDFGKTDRYATKDGGKDFNFRVTGDGTSWDSGRESSITRGSSVETDTQAADVETPGVTTQPASPPIKPEKP